MSSITPVRRAAAASILARPDPGALAFVGARRDARRGAAENRLDRRAGVRRLAVAGLRAEQQAGDAGGQPGRVVRAAPLADAAFQRRPDQCGARHDDADVVQAGVAAADQPAVLVDRADRKKVRRPASAQQAAAAVAPGAGDDQHVVLVAVRHGRDQFGGRLPPPLEQSAADVKDVGAVIHRQDHRLGQIGLRAAQPVVAEDRRQQSAAQRRDAFDRAAGLAEDQAGDMRALCGRVPVGPLGGRRGLERSETRAAKAIMCAIHRSIQYRDGDLRIAATEREQNFLLEIRSYYPYHLTPPALTPPLLLMRATRMQAPGNQTRNRRPPQTLFAKFRTTEERLRIFLIALLFVFLSRHFRRENHVIDA